MSALLHSVPIGEAYVRERPVKGGAETLPELATVVIDIPVTTLEGDEVPAGSQGTIVAVWRDGEAYDLEFADALGTATIGADHVKVVANR